MAALVTDQDYSDEIAALPKHAGYSTLPPRSGEQYVTLHYSGVVYSKTNRAGQLQRILDEASYQLHHDYGGGSYPDGLLYDVVCLDDGWRVLTRAVRQQLWHVGNATGNAKSWSIHLMLGPNQDATDAQWKAVVNVIEQLCSIHSIPRMNVVGHNEWPRHDGKPIPSSTYTLLPEQSECPGKVLHSRLAAWRAQATDPLKAKQIAGPHGGYVFCSVELFDFYNARGGFPWLGYPLRDEFYDTSLDCYILVCERAVLKRSAQFGKEFALLAEAKREVWI